MGCAEGLVKLLVFSANLVFALGGLTLIIIGVVYKLNIQQFTDAIPAEAQTIELVPLLTIIVGVIIFVIAFFGCCGAIRESPCLLTTYSIILLTIFILQITVGVYAFLEIKDEANLKKKVSSAVEVFFNQYEKKNSSRELVDLIQQQLECCGTVGPKYWENLPVPNNPIIPNTCYEATDPKENLFTDGCSNEFFDFLTRSVRVIGITILALSSLEVVGSIFSLCLSSSIRNRERRFRY